MKIQPSTYAELDSSGKIIGEHNFFRQLINIETHENGTPKFKIVEIESQDIDKSLYTFDGHFYKIEKDKVIKARKIRELDPEEKEVRRKRKLQAERQEKLPSYDESIEIVARVLTEVVKTLYYMETVKDPMTKVNVSKEDYKKLQDIVALSEKLK